MGDTVNEVDQRLKAKRRHSKNGKHEKYSCRSNISVFSDAGTVAVCIA